MGVARRVGRDDVVTSVLHQAPDLAMVYLTERLGTSQQILIDAVAGEIKSAQDEGSVRPGERQGTRRDDPADHPVDDPVGSSSSSPSSTPPTWSPSWPAH